MKKLILYDERNSKVNNEKLLEVDITTLENFGAFHQAKEFLEIPDMQIDKKSIIEWFTCGNFSMWWFGSPIIHPIFKNGALFLDKLSFLIETDNFNELKLDGCYDKLEIIKQLCKKKKIKFSFSKRKYLKFLMRQKVKNLLKSNYYKYTQKNKTKKRLDTFFKFGKYSKPDPGYVLITSPDHYRRKSFNLDSNQNLQKEFFIQPFLDFCSKNNVSLLCIDMNYSLKGSTNLLKERLQTKNIWLPIEYFLNFSNTKINSDSFKFLNQSIETLRKKDLSKIFSYDEIDLSNIIKPGLKDLFLEPNFPTYFILLNNIEKFLKETRPSLIIQTYEAGPYAKIFELAASRLDIKTIGIQHGSFNSDTPDYFFSQIRGISNPLGNIIPDLTLVFGEYYKKILTEKSAYPENSVEIFGNPEYFDLEKIKMNLNKSKLRKKLNLTAKKVFLVSLSFRFTLIKDSYDHKLLQILYNNFKNNNELIFIIRPHPGDAFNESFLQKNFPSKNFILSTNSLVEDFVVSDAVIVLPISTVSIEAILFDIPIIFPYVDTKNQNKVDGSISELLSQNNLATFVDEFTLIEIIKNNMSDKINNFKITTASNNFNQKEKIKKYLCNIPSIPEIDKYIFK